MLSSSCELYVASEGSRSIASLCTARSGAAAATYADHVYVFGGKGGGDERHQNLDDGEQYDVMADKWTVIQSRMSDSRSEFAAVCLDELVYLVGGSVFRFDNTRTRAETFDPKQQQFANLLPLPYERWNPSACSVSMSVSCV